LQGREWIVEKLNPIIGDCGVPEADGQVYKWTHHKDTRKNYEHLLPFFEVLTMMLQLGLMEKNAHGVTKIVETNTFLIRDTHVQIEASAAIEKAASGYLSVAREADRMRSHEIASLKVKRDALVRRKAEIEKSATLEYYFSDFFGHRHAHHTHEN
jgi:hypothetical protein